MERKGTLREANVVNIYMLAQMIAYLFHVKATSRKSINLLNSHGKTYFFKMSQECLRLKTAPQSSKFEGILILGQHGFGVFIDFGTISNFNILKSLHS